MQSPEVKNSLGRRFSGVQPVDAKYGKMRWRFRVQEDQDVQRAGQAFCELRHCKLGRRKRRSAKLVAKGKLIGESHGET